MALAPGQQLGSYEILAPIGAGAMGQVYRAKDTRLDREIAIKVLPDDFAKDEERLHRFQREAKSLASLNHVNIAQIYSVDQIDDTNFLSLEFVPGQTLDEILQRGPLPLEEALRIGRDIATGLEVAHEAGVIHRDLKPANIRVTPDGVAKVLDFGLAKPTGTNLLETKPKSALTQADGRLLGTPTYMAPEQIAGKPIDRRIDIWAFGCVLYECLTGKRAFDADSVGTLFAAIATEPIDLRKLSAAPAPVRRLLERCLRKDPQERLRDAGDARVVLSDVLAGRGDEGSEQQSTPRTSRALMPLGMVVVGLIGAGIGWTLAPNDEVEKRPIERFSIALPPPAARLVPDTQSGTAPPIAISPDGRRIVFAARSLAGTKQLYERLVGSSQITPLDGTKDGDNPFFSDDGKHIVFSKMGSGDLVQMTTDGSIAPLLVTSSVLRGAAWGLSDQVVVADERSGLTVTPASGGNRKSLTKFSEDEFNHRWPQFLPGGKLVLYTAYSKSAPHLRPHVVSLETQETTRLDVNGWFARYLPERGSDGQHGFLLYCKSGELWAVRLDLATRKTSGKPASLVQGIHVSPLGIPHVAISASGVLVYEPTRPPSPGRMLVWVDRATGEKSDLWDGKGFEFPRLHANDSRISFAHHTDLGIHEVWDLDLQGDKPAGERISDPGNFVRAVWFPDENGILLTEFHSQNLWIKNPLSTSSKRLLRRPGLQFLHERSDQDRFLFQERTKGQWDLCELKILDLEGHKFEVRMLVSTPESETSGTLSANGKWYAYVSEDSGHTDIYVSRYHAAWDKPLGRRRPVVFGTEPRWAKSKNKNELFFRRGTSFYVVQISDEDGRPVGEPKELFKGPYVAGFNNVSNYDVTSDGKRFVMVDGGWGLTTGRLDVRLNFHAELEAALPRESK